MSLRRSRPLEDALRVVRNRATQGLGVARRRRSTPGRGLSEREQRRLSGLLSACLEPQLGEVVARARAGEVAERYRSLDTSGRAAFFELVAREAGPDPERVNLAVASFEAVAHRATGSPRASSAELVAAGGVLRAALRPGWERLFRLLCSLDGGVKFTVDMRADLLGVLATARGSHPPADTEAAAGTDAGAGAEGAGAGAGAGARNGGSSGPPLDAALLACVDDDLRDVLKGFVDIGRLELRRITWDTPASFLEKLIRYEAVHAITSWADLKNRLRPDRRCYAFVHAGLPDEPLIFVEVALVNGMSDRIGPLLDLEAPLGSVGSADTATFYSISSCQDGLAGISLGDFLIKRVVDDLQRELPGLRRFATLSPIPGLRAWMAGRVEADPAELLALLDDDQRRALAALGLSDASTGEAADASSPPPEVTDGEAALQAATNGLRAIVGDTGWPPDPAHAEALRPTVLRLAAHYLTKVQRQGRAVDRVGHFHLSNGARVERVNWAANPAPAGLRESLGVMVNYCYDPDRIEANHTDYVVRHRIVASAPVSRLAG